jgi:hypothetical protein
MEYEVILVDASKSPVEKIICTGFAKGKTHDFRLFKNSKVHLEDTNAITDSGYQGITNIHTNENVKKRISLEYR